MKEQIKHILLTVLGDRNKAISIEKDYFFLPTCYMGKYYAEEIFMNPLSFSIIFDSLIASTPNSAYIVSLINFFQALETPTEDSRHLYQSSSHSVTTYYLRLLAKQGLIKIHTIECEGRSIDVNLSPYFQALGNPIDENERQFKIYNVVFQKIRNMDARDIEPINKTLKAFNIPPGEIKLNLDGDILHAKISNKAVARSIASGEFARKLKNIIEVLLEDYVETDDYEHIKKILPKNKNNR